MNYFSSKKKWLAYLVLLTFVFTSIVPAGTVFATEPGGAGEKPFSVDGNTVYLNNVTLTETLNLTDLNAEKIIVSGNCTIDAGEGNGIQSDGAVSIEGNGSLTITGTNGIMAASVTINGIDVDFTGASCGIQVYNENGDATVTLTEVNGNITGGYAGIYVNGEYANSNASVTMEGCDLDVVSTASSSDKRARKSGISVYVSKAEKVESSINILNSNVNATGYDAGLSINNYLGDADATNSASAKINITNSTVVANGTSGTWSGIFASVLGQHLDADAVITLTNSSVYATSTNIGIMTSSQKGKTKIILDKSILGVSGKNALNMKGNDGARVQVAELKNGSTYVQMTPMAAVEGEIIVESGKTIVATAGDGITYNAAKNYYVIPQGSTVIETFTNGTVKEYTFKNQAGGIGGSGYEKEEIWGFDIPDGNVCYIKETGVYYESLSAAVDDANASTDADTIVMLKDIDFDKTLSIKGTVTIVGEYTITRGENFTGTFFTVPKGASLTLDGGLTIDGNNNWDMDMDLYNEHLETMAQQGISIYTAGMDRNTEIDPYNTEKASQYFTPEAGAPIATDYMIKVTGAGTVNLNDVTIQNNYTPKSGLVNTSAGTVVNLEGAKILHCASVEGSGTVLNASGKITINIEDGTLIDGNHVGGNHGLFRVYSGAVVNMSGGAISNTTGWNSNGVVIGLYGAGSTFNMSGGLITGNSSVFGADNGRNAAVYLHANSTMNMTGGTISFNNGRSRGGIDTYKETSTLNINRADQYFVDGVYLNENSKDAYKSSNHPMIVDNLSRANNSNHDVGTSNGNYLHWWVTGGIYTQDVDEYCAKGYVCIPYEDSERTDDYIVVPGYRVNYYTVEEKIVTNDETGEATTEYETTLEMKLFHLLPRDKFWYEMDERADYYELHNDAGGTISTWYTEKELTNIYNFDTKLENDINLYGKWNVKADVDSEEFLVTKTVKGDNAPDNAYEFQLKIDARVEKWTAVLATKKWELERAIEKAEADLKKAKDAVSESEIAFKANAVTFTTGSAYKFVMADEPVTTSGSALEYAHTIADQSGNISTTTSSAILWDSLTTDKEETAIDAVIDTIKTIAKGFVNMFQNGWKVDLLQALNVAESSTPSALGFYTKDAEALLKAENDKLAAEENIKAAKIALEDFMKNEATTPTAIKVTFTPQEGSESRLESKVFELAPDANGHVIGFNLFGSTGYKVNVEATTGAMVTYRVSEVGGFETEDYLNTQVIVDGKPVATGAPDAELVRNTGELTLAGNIIEFINNYRNNGNNNNENDNTNNNDNDDDTTTTDPEETIDDPKVPLGDVETPEEIIDDPEIPLGDIEVPGEPVVEDELEDPEIPLGDAPATGDANNAVPFMALMMFALCGLVITRRKFN